MCQRCEADRKKQHKSKKCHSDDSYDCKNNKYGQNKCGQKDCNKYQCKGCPTTKCMLKTRNNNCQNECQKYMNEIMCSTEKLMRCLMCQMQERWNCYYNKSGYNKSNCNKQNKCKKSNCNKC